MALGSPRGDFSGSMRRSFKDAMDQEKPQGKIFCRHELARTTPAPKTLHERMMLEAEPIIQHNWTDVAIHDKNRLKRVKNNHVMAWMVNETGSYLSPMYCNISDKKNWTSSPMAALAPVQIFMNKLHYQLLAIGVKAAGQYKPHCYLVIKKDDTDGGEIVPVNFEEFASFCTIGQFQWTLRGFQPCK
jgi:hypothetical protein